jgi:hypothetical protein
VSKGEVGAFTTGEVDVSITGEVPHSGRLLHRIGRSFGAQDTRQCALLGQTFSGSNMAGGVVLPILMQSKSWVGSRSCTAQSVLSSTSFGSVLSSSTGASLSGDAREPGHRPNSRSSSDSSVCQMQQQQQPGGMLWLAGHSLCAGSMVVLGRVGSSSSSRTVPVIPLQLPKIVSDRGAAAAIADADALLQP